MKLKLLGKVLVFTLTPIVLGIVLLTTIASNLSSRGLYGMADVQLLEYASKQASEIDNIVKSVVSLGNLSSSMDNIENLVVLANKEKSGEEPSAEFKDTQTKAINYLAEIVEDFNDVTVAVIVDKNAKIIAGSSAASMKFDVRNYKSIIDGLAGKSSIETRLSQTTGKMSAMVATPITDDADNIADGVLLLVLDLASIANETIQDVKLMPSSNLFMLGSDGVMLMERSFPELIGKDNTIYEYVRTVLAEKNGITRYEWEGIDKLTHFAELPTTKWIVGIETDESDFYTVSDEIALILSLAGLVIVLIVGIIVYVVIKKVVVTVSHSAIIASSVASGNLELTREQEMQIQEALKRNDEFATLAEAFSAMIKNLAKMVYDSEEKSKEAQSAAESAEIASKEAERSAVEAEEKRKSILVAVEKLEGIVNNIASASEQLSAQIEISTQGAEEQSARMAETSTAMEEMNGTVLEVARSSSESAKIADSTKEKATAGASITQKCQDSMADVKNESLKLRNNMSELANHAQSITAVMGVISDIADQTNLLALNAAIEAARAGDAGRGFAVVADEVRKLAEKTISSTTDVANAISAIQQSTEVNVKQVDMAVERIEQATELAIEGGEALQGILEMAEESADGIRSIATASEEQSATSDEISQSIVTVSNIANNTVSAMNEASSAVASLADQAQQLASLVENLKNS